MPSPSVFNQNVWFAAPNPFKILFKVPDKYRQGQIKDSVLIKVPANSFLKSKSPSRLPPT